MPPHQRFESPSVALCKETLEELRIGEPRGHAVREQAFNLPQGSASVSMAMSRSPLVPGALYYQ